MDFPGGSVVKTALANAGDAGSILRLGRSLGLTSGNPLQYSCLGNPMDRGSWQATVHGILGVEHDFVTKPPEHPMREHFGFCCSSAINYLSLWVLHVLEAQFPF